MEFAFIHESSNELSGSEETVPGEPIDCDYVPDDASPTVCRLPGRANELCR